MNAICIILSCLAISSLFSESKVLQFPTFELLSGRWNEKKEEWRHFSSRDQEDLERFSANYQKKAYLLFSHLPTIPRIPRVIHFIWVGPKSFPKESVENIKAWRELHPEWIIKFWTDSKERPCPIDSMEKHLIDEIAFLHLKPYLAKTTNYGEQADLIRYELIYQEGGLYVDHDVMPFRAFDALNSGFDFYVGLENPHLNPGIDTKVFPCNCLFGARPFHPILKKTIQYVMDRWESVEKKYPGNDPDERFNRVINRTFHSFTLATKLFLNTKGMSDIVLPSSFLFAHKLFPETTLKRLKAQGLVYGCHDFAAAWVDKKSSSSTAKKSKHKRKK